LQVFNKGAVIVAGQPFLTIVPNEDKLAIEAKVQPNNIDQVKMHSSARYRFTSLNQRTTPEFDGEVYRISADAETDQRTGAMFYTVRVTIDDAEMQRLPPGTRIIPGMPTEVFIKTEDRTVLSYLIKPMSDQMMRAFRER
jgi:HlyD family secretion protein